MGHNCAEASSANTLMLLNHSQNVSCCSPLSPSDALITPVFFSVTTLWFSAHLSPLEVSRPECMSTPGGFYCSSRAQWWRCYMLLRHTKIKAQQKRPSRGCCKGPGDFFCTCIPNLDQLNWTGNDLIWPPPHPHPATISSRCWISIVGLFCGEALVKWAIIPVGESDDDFWQNAAAARCQTIRAVAISSRGRAGTHANSHHKQAVSH